TERQYDQRVGQGNLFEASGDGGASAIAANNALLETAEWPQAELLKYEKEVLDFYLSSHPLAQMEKEIKRYATHTVAEIAQLPAEREITLGGMVTQLRYMNTKKARNGNSRYLRCKIEDFSGAV